MWYMANDGSMVNLALYDSIWCEKHSKNKPEHRYQIYAFSRSFPNHEFGNLNRSRLLAEFSTIEEAKMELSSIALKLDCINRCTINSINDFKNVDDIE